MAYAYHAWRTRLPLWLLICCLLTGCDGPEVTGPWVSEQKSFLVLYFYPDNTAALSGIGFGNLQWKQVDRWLVRIDAFDRKVVAHFKMAKDAKGYYGTLELAGYDTMVFRKRI